jgi:hypothetical protein
MYTYNTSANPCISMHEARWSREKYDADNRRTRGSILRAAMSNASHERTSRVWARASLFETAAAISSQLRLRARLERPFRANCGSGPRSSGHFARQLQSFRANCGSGPGSSGHFEPTAAPGQARAAISSQQRLRARLEVANVGRCGVFEPGE